MLTLGRAALSVVIVALAMLGIFKIFTVAKTLVIYYLHAATSFNDSFLTRGIAILLIIVGAVTLLNWIRQSTVRIWNGIDPPPQDSYYPE